MFCQWRYALSVGACLSVGVYLGSGSTSRPVRMYLSCGSMSCPVGARLVLWEFSRPVGVSTVGEYIRFWRFISLVVGLCLVNGSMSYDEGLLRNYTCFAGSVSGSALVDNHLWKFYFDVS